MILWDEKKNKKLKLERGIGFEDFMDTILNGEYLDILEHPSRPHQNIFVVERNRYIFAIPFVIDKDQNIILKTAFPSRTLHRKYRGERI
jgi:hypothetical protein